MSDKKNLPPNKSGQKKIKKAVGKPTSVPKVPPTRKLKEGYQPKK